MQIKKWKGLKNTTSPDRLLPGELLVAQNVEIDDAEALRSRTGLTSIVASAAHSLWSTGPLCLFVQNAVIKRLHPDESVTTLATLRSNRPMAFVEANGTVYYSNGIDKGRITAEGPAGWGAEVPLSQPAAAYCAGSLPPGEYQYAMTFLRQDGHEGGTGLSGLITLTEQGGIYFSSMEVSTNQALTGKILYVGEAGSEVLYRVAVLPMAQTSYFYRESPTALGAPLINSMAGPPPAGDILEIYNGVMFVVQGSVVYASDPYAFELFRQAESFLQFPGPVTMFAAVNDGVYVASTEATWFLSGPRVDQMKSRQVFDYGVIAGTATKTDASYFSKKESPGGGSDELGSQDGAAVVWTSPRGVCVGLDGGVVKNLTETTYSFPSGQRGAGIVRQARGITQYLNALQGTGVANNNY